MRYRTIIEPFRIHSVQSIPFPDERRREEALREASYNLFFLRARDITIDLLTDSGTGAMSSRQWAGMLDGDESYAGSRSFERFRDAVREVTGFREVIPTHQGRAAEHILFSLLVRDGSIVPSNHHFDTTRANIEVQGGEAVDLPCRESEDSVSDFPFKGNLDVEALERLLDGRGRGQVPVVMCTITDNSGGGQPVSLANVRAVSEVCRARGVPFFLDACRFAENAWFVKTREPGQSERTVGEIAREMFSLADGCTFSAKKDGLSNIGGFLATNDPDLAREARNVLVLTEGFPTYGGLAGYDLEAVAVGLREALEEDYLRYRCRSVAYLAERLRDAGVAVLWPPGGHAVYLDARAIAPHVAPDRYPAQAVAVDLYRRGAVRACELGSVMFGRRLPDGREEPAARELVRLAIPRRTYTQSHIDYVGEVVVDTARHADRLPGYRIVEQAKYLRHFTCRFEEVEPAG